MTDAPNPIPSAQSGDSDDVELALETAQRLHRNGDFVEALRWLRRAVNSADEAGDDRRQLELARAAADYTAQAAGASVVPATTSVPPVVPSVPPANPGVDITAPATPANPSRLPQPPAKQPPPAPSSRASLGPSTAAPTTTVTPRPAAPSAAAAATSGAPAGRSRAPAPSNSVAPHVDNAVSIAPARPRSPESQIPPAPRAPSSVSAPVVVDQTPSSPPPPKPAGDESRAPLGGVATVTKPTKAPSTYPERGTAAPASVPPSGMHSMSGPSGPMRVAVRVSARDERLYVARPLAAGQRLPAGCQEAWLVFDEACVVASAAGSSRG